MSYFGGLGAGKGWLKFLFLVETEVLREVLEASKAVLVITNGRVPADYESTPLSDYLDAYDGYIKAMLESPDAASRASVRIYMGLAASLDRFVPKPCAGGNFKLMDSEEPVANLAPRMLHYDENRGKLCTNFITKLYFGVEISYPRVVSLDRDKHEVIYDTAEFASYAIFQDVKSRIQKITRPCKMRSAVREHRTAIRITEGMRESMRNHPGLRTANLDIV